MRTESAVCVKGAGVLSSRKWIEETYGPDTLESILGSVSPEAAGAFTNALVSDWYPVELINDVWTALETHCGTAGGAADRDRFRRLMVRHGAYIARDNLSTVYDLLVLVAKTPRELFKLLPHVWTTYFSGVEIELDTSALDEGRGVLRVRGLGALHHISPAACGWTDVAFDKIRADGFHVEEESYAAGETASDELVFHMSWS